MDQSSGKKIKSLASIIFTLGMLSSGILGFIVASPFFEGRNEVPILGIIIFLIIAGGGTLLSWASTIVLHGFGELVENVADIKNRLYLPSDELPFIKIIAASTQSANGILENAANKKSTPSSTPTNIKTPNRVSVQGADTSAHPTGTTPANKL